MGFGYNGKILRVDLTSGRTAVDEPDAKFYRRFRYIEEKVKRQGRRLKDASLAEMDALWEEAKRQERDS